MFDIRKDFMLNLHMHDVNPNVQVTTANSPGNDLSPEMKVFYSDYLIDNAKPLLVHDQFGQKHPIPKNGGKTIEFRKYDPFPKATTPIVEGVTPNGRSLNVSTITSTVAQYGDYVTLSDVLLLTAIDNNMVEATELLGQQAGETLDWVTREVINAGTNVQYAGGRTSRGAIKATDVLKVEDIKKAVRTLKNANAKKIDGTWVGIVCPNTSYDLMADKDWIDASLYAGSTQLFDGEIGKIHGVRFVETTEAKVWEDAGYPCKDYYTVVGTKTTDVALDEDKTYYTVSTGVYSAVASPDVTDIATYYEVVGTKVAAPVVADIGTYYELSDGVYALTDDVAIPTSTVDVYSTLIIGANAYGVTEVEGGGLQHIVKQLGSGGSTDPLNQRATVGWKAIKTAEILVDSFMVRIESAASA